MKVLEKGTGQKGWSVECRCTGHGNGFGGCGAKLLVEIADLFETNRSCMGESESFVTFKCIECDVLTDLNPTQQGQAYKAKRGNFSSYGDWLSRTTSND